MKKLLIITFLSLFLNATGWCPITGLKISEHLESSYQARLESNNALRVYASLYALLQDRKNFGLKEIKKYDIKSGEYLLVELEESLYIEKNPLAEVYKKRHYPMGKKLFKKRCPEDFVYDEFFEIVDLKYELQKSCDLRSELHLHATAVYLWDVKREGGAVFNEKKVQVKEDEKCPVCGMFVYKYPRWAAQIFHTDKHYSFDGVKCMMRYFFEQTEAIKEIKVTDYYSLQAIDGKKAFYVIGSTIYGPMGHELIPFLELEDAKTFKEDHDGKAILEFHKIEPTLTLFEN